MGGGGLWMRWRAAVDAELSRACKLVCVCVCVRHPVPCTPCVQVSAHERCRVRVAISAEAGAAGGEGHKVMLAAVMVTHKVPPQE